jgi:FAD/FMN-containing dehydrogenase
MRAPALFDAMLGGLGQCGVIARAVVGLQPALAAVRLFDLLYVDLTTFAADARTVVRDGRFDTVQGLVVPSATGGWAYLLEATSSLAHSNDELQRARCIGGHDYPVGATPVTRRDWEQHFGAQ